MRIRFIHAAGLRSPSASSPPRPPAPSSRPPPARRESPARCPTRSPGAVGDELSRLCSTAGPPGRDGGLVPGWLPDQRDLSILSSGDATLAGNGQATFAGVTNGSGDGGHGTAVQDLVTLRLNLNVPASANCFSIDFRFLSEEYPTFVGSSVNDGFVAELDTSDFQGDGNAVTAPHNFAFDEAGNVISVNTAGISAANAAGTVYGGGTSLLRASTPVSPGLHSVYLSVFDQGDSNYDSAAFLDRAVMTNTPPSVCKAGASNDVTPPDTTITDGPAEGGKTGATRRSHSHPRSRGPLPVQPRRRRVRGLRQPGLVRGPLQGRPHVLRPAFDSAGNGDPTPASRSFKVKGGKQLSAPVAGESVNLNVVNGTIKYPGVSQTASAGSTTRGRSTSAAPWTPPRQGAAHNRDQTGETQSADFYDGVFKIGRSPTRPR